jgi:hypothetical protein
MRRITTIKISTETKDRLDKLKEYHRETYDDLIKKILYILNTARKDPEKSKNLLFSIDSRTKKQFNFNKNKQNKSLNKIQESAKKDK